MLRWALRLFGGGEVKRSVVGWGTLVIDVKGVRKWVGGKIRLTRRISTLEKLGCLGEESINT